MKKKIEWIPIKERIKLIKMDGEKLYSFLIHNEEYSDELKEDILEDHKKYENNLNDYEKYEEDMELENKRFKSYVQDELEKRHGYDEQQSFRAVEESSVNYMLYTDPSFVGHYSPEYWADWINEYV